MSTKASKLPLLSGNALKIIALIAMTLDHIGVQFFPTVGWLRVVGRLAFPIFAYMIAEGATYTKHRARYFGTIAALAAVLQVVYFVTMHSLYMCIFVTFTLSLCLIYSLDYAMEKLSWSVVLALLVWLGVVFVSGVLPMMKTGTDFFVDYGPVGVLIPAALYYTKGKWPKLLVLGGLLVLLALYANLTVQWYALLVLPLLALYSGKRGKYKLKYLFYIYYPVHLAVIWAIARWL